ncbi:DUF2497 domain-containing protein [Microvirga guangxiensis]|nr:DUF2497 domain-containing protein [Microvirga guangxiensis]
MEDILASIRRIISDEQESAQEPAFADAESSPLKTVLEIAERHVSSNLYPEHLSDAPDDQPLIQDDPFEEERSIAHFAEARELARPDTLATAQSSQVLTQPCERDPGDAMISRMTETSVSEAFGKLNAVRAASHSPTVEDLMKEMLRPMLKAWLDENLPALVERLVKAEIERVTRG